MSDEKPEGTAIVTPEQLQQAIDDYLKNRHLDDAALAALAAEAQLTAEEAEQAAVVEDEALVQERTPEEQQAWRDRMLGVYAAQEAQGAPAAQVAAPQVGTPQAPPAPEALPQSLQRLAAIPSYQPETAVDPAYAKTYPPVAAPASLFDLVLRDDMFPQNSFFTDWMRLFCPTTDAPRSFHLATAIATLATAMGPRWTLKHCSGGLRANVWFMMLADSGTRKSTVMKVPRKIWADDDTTCWEGPVESTRVWFDRSVQERQIGDSEHDVLWIFDESATFFSMLEKPQTKDLGDRLTSAYNGERLSYTAASLRNVALEVPNPYLSILTGTPVYSLRQRGLREDVLRGGIFGRFLLVPGATLKKLALPPAPDPIAFNELKRNVRALHAARQKLEMTLSYGAEQTYRAWYEGRGTGGTLADTSTGIWNRAGDHVLKLAMIYHVATYRDPATPIQQDTMEQAITFMQDFLLPGHLWATVRLIEHSPVKRAYLAIQDYIARPGGVLYQELMELLGVTLDTLAKYLATLYKADRVGFWWWREDPGWSRGGSKILVAQPGVKPVVQGKLWPVEDGAPRAVQRFLNLVGEGELTYQEQLEELDELTRRYAS